MNQRVTVENGYWRIDKQLTIKKKLFNKIYKLPALPTKGN